MDVGKLLEILDREMGDGAVSHEEILTYLEELARRGLVEVEEPEGSQAGVGMTPLSRGP
jgi:hypothetical protein